MEVFPDIQPITSNFKQEIYADGAIRSDPTKGAFIVRQRTDASPTKFNISYLVSDADHDLLVAFEENIGWGGEDFYWQHPLDKYYYVAKLLAPINYKIHPQSKDVWNVSLNIALL